MGACTSKPQSSSDDDAVVMPLLSRDLMNSVRQLNDSVYELFKPDGKPSLQVLFFHGLEPRNQYEYAHLSTWASGDGSGTMWPQTWFVEKFPGAEVLSVSYESSIRVTRELGITDMYIVAENLISDLIMADVGQIARCPVILVGHSFGGLVMKELCVQVSIRSASERGFSKLTNFLNSVKGLFFYSTPHRGLSMESTTRFLSKGPLHDYVKRLRSNSGRSNHTFEQLEKQFNWQIAGVGEGRSTKDNIYVIEEASSRYRNYVTVDADHFSVCKPTSRHSSEFSAVTMFVDQVVQDALEVVSGHRVWVLEYVAGLEERLRDIQGLLTEVPIVVVVGMGGIGKTTIAKVLFNQMSTDFEYTACVEEVRSIPIHLLEDRLLSFLHHMGNKVDPAEIKWSHLQEKRVLIVMDDVNSVDELLIILGRLSRFGNGSRLIITSRNREVSQVCDHYAIYEVPFLRKDEAMRLLCHHVFGTESIPKDLIEMNSHLEKNVERAVDKCEGLPLTVEVIGRYLRHRESEASFWEGTIDRLANARSVSGAWNDFLWSSLRLGFDGLAETEQNVFIDAATYFYEQPVEQALAAWDSAYGHSHVIWENLLNTFMVKEVHKSTGDILGKEETQYVTVWVHSQLRDMAKKLSRDHVRSGFKNANWLRANPSNLQLPSGDQEYLTASSSSSQMMVPSDLLDNPESLRYLDLDGVMIDEGLLQKISRRLSLLRWKMRSISQLPLITIEKMQELAVLELSNWKIPEGFFITLGKLTNLHILYLSQLEGLDHLPTNFGDLVRLKRLELMDLPLSMLPESFGNLAALEYLALVNVTNISALPESFGHLCSLRELVLRRCARLQSLPESLPYLRALQKLTIEDADELQKLPDGFGMLSALESLTIRHCQRLESLPDSVGELQSLRLLVLDGCVRLNSLPDNLGRLRALQRLELVNLGLLSLPESFGDLCSLRELVLLRCARLKRLPETLSLSALQKLTIEDADELQKLPDGFGMLSALESLTIRHCRRLESLPDSVGELQSLRLLVLDGCVRLNSLPDNLGRLRALQRLELVNLFLVRFPSSFCDLAALEYLALVNLSKISALPESFGHLCSLRELVLLRCARLKRLPESLSLSPLQKLTIEDADELQKLPEGFGMLSALESLTIRHCQRLESLSESLGLLISLKDLTLVSLGVVAFPESVGELSLRTLTIQDCEKLESFPLSFKHLRILERLVVEGCVQLDVLADRDEDPSALQNVTLVNASNLVSCGSLGMLSALKHLTLVNVSIEEFPESFQELSSLVTLTIRSCLELSSLPHSLGRLSSLEGLYIHNCPKLSSLPVSFGHLASLKELYIYGCPVVRDPALAAVVQAYFENNSLTADLHIDWSEVRDASLRTKLKVFRDKNLRLQDLTEKLRAPQLEDDRRKEENRSKEDDKLNVEDKPKEEEKAKHKREPKEEDNPQEQEEAKHESEAKGDDKPQEQEKAKHESEAKGEDKLKEQEKAKYEIEPKEDYPKEQEQVKHRSELKREDKLKELEKANSESEPKGKDKTKEQEKTKHEREPNGEDKPKEHHKTKHKSEPTGEDRLTDEDVTKTEVKDCIPFTCGKVFLCGNPEVGKTTLRKTLKRCLQEDCWTMFKLERGPNCISQPRTSGIEIRRIEEKRTGGVTLNLWDLAGQQEYHVLHGNFFLFAGQGPAGGKATTFVLVFRVTFTAGDEKALLYWLRFVKSGSSVKRHVAIVLNRFGFNFGSIENHRRKWQHFIDRYKKDFKDSLDIHSQIFLIDVRVASKVKILKEHLFDYVREELSKETMPLLCRDIQVKLKPHLLPDGKIGKFHPILTWQAFEEKLELESKRAQLSSAASYLHEMGDIIYFDKNDSNEPWQEDRILVVPDPEWFCKEVVGSFLLPMKMRTERNRQKNKNPERISSSDFEFLFAPHLDRGTPIDAVISMLESLGLCYKIRDDASYVLIVPSLTVGDFDYKSNGWDKGVNLVMGRCLTFVDKNTTAIPMTLFRKLQVGLARNEDLGGLKSSSYRAAKSFSIFKVGQLLVLVQFDEAEDDLRDNRVDILVKSTAAVITDRFASHIDYICQVMQLLQDLCAECCSGVTWDIKVIKPWRAPDKDPRMIERDIGVSLKEIKDLVKKNPDETSTWESELQLDLQWKTFLSDSELKELLGFSPEERQKERAEQRDYEDCKRAAVDMGLLEDLSLSEGQKPPENSSSSEIQVWETEQEPLENLNSIEIQLLKLEEMMKAGFRANEEKMEAVGRDIRTHIDKKVNEVILEIRNKHQLLAKKIQAQHAFSNQQHSVPRFMFLSRKDGFWIKLQEAIGQSTFQLHLLCEANVKTGIVHPVKDQEGIEIPVSDEFLLRVEPWVRWTLQVVVTVGKTVGQIYFPGVFSLIPYGLSYPEFVNRRTELLLNKDEGGKLVPDSHRNFGTKGKGTEIGLIAKDVIKDLMASEKPGDFVRKTKLRKVRLKEYEDQPSVGPSKQTQRSVAWICFDCHKEYKDRVEDVE